MHDSEYVACPCCGETMQFVRTGSRANRSEMQTFECKPCGLVVATEALRGSTQPLLERRYYY
jgi:transposase-like protein